MKKQFTAVARDRRTRAIDLLISEVEGQPRLTREEEIVLGRRVRDFKDEKAVAELATRSIGIVIFFASRYRQWKGDIGDLISAGNIGLLKSIMAFDPDRGIRLASYASHAIAQAITRFMVENRSIVPFVNHGIRRKIYFKITKVKNSLGLADATSLTVEQAGAIAVLLEAEIKATVDVKDVIDIHRRMANMDKSLNAQISSNDADSPEVIDFLVDEDQVDQETAYAEREIHDIRSHTLKEALALLNEQERDVIVRRRLNDEPETLKDIGDTYGVSRERIRQIEVKAFEKISKYVLKSVAA